MTMRALAATTFILTSLADGRPVAAAPIPAIDVAALVAKSDIIVTGRHFESILQLGKLTNVTIRVDRAIKGKVTSGATLDIGTLQDKNGAPGYYGIYFLRGQPGQLQSADPDVHGLAAAPPAFEQFAPQREPIDEIAAELVSVFAIPPDVLAQPNAGLAPSMMMVPIAHGRNKSGKEIIKWERASSLRRAEDVYLHAWDSLRSIPDEVKRPFLLHIVDSPGPLYGRLWAYATLLGMGDNSRIDDATDYLLHPSEQARTTNAILKKSFLIGSFDEAQAPFFARIISSTNERIREGAIYQLRMMKSEVAYRALEIALRDEDPDVRQPARLSACSHISACSSQAPDTEWKNTEAVAAAYHQWLTAAYH